MSNVWDVIEYDTIADAQAEMDAIDNFWQAMRFVFVKPNGKYVGIAMLDGFPYNHPRGWHCVCSLVVPYHITAPIMWDIDRQYEGDKGNFYEVSLIKGE